MQIHAEISYVHGLCHLCQRNFSYRGKGRGHQTSTTPWEPHPAESLPWNDHHGKFTRSLNSILQPLNQLLQGNQEFKWSPRCEEAFKKAKESLSSSNVLVHYDPSLPVILESDASQYGIGAVIFHRFPNGNERPIAYASKSIWLI